MTPVTDPWSVVADEFAAVREAVYLNHAASAPLPRRAAAALERHLRDRQRLFHLYQSGTQDYDTSELRGKLGQLMNAPPENVGFAPTTTDAISGLLNGIAWRSGDNVVLAANEFPGVVYACLHLERRGVEVRQVPVTCHLDLADLAARLDGRTRAAVVSHVHWQTGHRVDLERLASACRAVGALAVVDAIQSLGAVPLDLTMTDVDFLAAGTYKWLLAIPGAAAIYAGPRVLAEVTPDRAGWAGMRTSVYDIPRLDWAPGAARFRVGGAADSVLIALERSVDLLLEVGIETVFRHVAGLIDRLAAGLPGTGLSLQSDLAADHRSTIVNVGTGSVERDAALARHLVGRGIIVARRGPGIRVSPHLHVTPDDIDRLLDTAAGILRVV